MILRNAKEATRYLKVYKRDLERKALLLQDEILALQNPLREAVAFLCDALARDVGHFWGDLEVTVGPQEQGMVISHLDLDDDFIEAFIDRWGEEMMDEASKTLLQLINGKSAILVSWALGKVMVGEGRGTATAYEDQIFFHLAKREVLAVSSLPNPKDPAAVKFLVGPHLSAALR